MRAKEFIREEPIGEAVPIIPALAAIARGGMALGGTAIRAIGNGLKSAAPAVAQAGSTALSTAARTAGTTAGNIVGTAAGTAIANQIPGANKPSTSTTGAEPAPATIKPGDTVDLTGKGATAKIEKIGRQGIQLDVNGFPVEVDFNSLTQDPEFQKILKSQPAHP